MPSAQVQVVQQLYAAFGRRDHAALRELMTADIEWNQMAGFPGGGRYVGADAIFAHVFEGFRDNWENWQAVVTDYLDAGEDVVALGYYTGTYQATGRSFHAAFAHHYTVLDGRIARFEQYTDTLKVAQAMGRAAAPA